MKRHLAILLSAVVLASAPAPARAGIPVIDVAAIAQLIQQVTYWTQQIQHMVTQVNQLRQTYDSISGQRGLGALLPIANAARNYLPEDAGALIDTAGGLAGAYAGVTGQIQTLLAANAVLTPQQLGDLTPAQRALVEDARRAAAALQGLSRTAYGNTSQRFAQLQQLLTAISATGDQKAILELSARIQSEQTMLQNEQNKLTTLYQVAQAQELARAQQVREHSVLSVGTFRALPAKAY
jgi:type IV secretion system protein VirB5